MSSLQRPVQCQDHHSIYIYNPFQADALLQISKFKKYGCEKCPYASGKRAQFERHLELHGSRQRYTCQFCDYSVPSSNLLAQVINTFFFFLT